MAHGAGEMLNRLYANGDYPGLEREASALAARSPEIGLYWQVLGVAQLAQGKDALAALRKAATYLPTDAGVLSQLAGALAGKKLWSEAVDCYQRIHALTPSDPAACYNLGVALQGHGDSASAAAAYRRAVALAPNFAGAHFNLGVLLDDERRDEEAAACYRQAVAAEPAHAAARYNLAIVLWRLGSLDEAEAMLRQTRKLCPEDTDVLNNLGLLLETRGNAAEAEHCYREALRLRPGFAEAVNNLGLALFSMKRFDEAEAAFAEALRLKPAFAEACNNLAALLYRQGRLEASEAAYRRALAYQPDYPEASTNLCQVLIDMGRLDEAEAGARAVLARQPSYAPAWSLLLFSHNYSGRVSPSACLEEARAYGRAMSARVRHRFEAWCCVLPPMRLRVGLVSGDLRDHPVGYFLESLLAQLDPRRVELFAYPTNHETSALTERIRPRFSAWRPLAGLEDAAAARLIHDDGVHVLIDLSGHSAHTRLPLFAWRPAPVQVAWLGYFATTGLAEMDYVLVDEVGVPPRAQGMFTERVRYLPDSRLCFSPPDPVPAVAVPPSAATGHLTFGCFQHLSKISDATLALWGRVFGQLATARLHIQSPQLGAGHAATTAALMQRLRDVGIADGRVSIHGMMSREHYLAAYSAVDALLDTYPYPGGTTTCEALWMGVPTLTLAGTTMIERQGASLLAAAGLGGWIAEDADAYVRKAVALAADLPALAALRANLREHIRLSPLCDAVRFARAFETELWQLWSDHERATPGAA